MANISLPNEMPETFTFEEATQPKTFGFEEAKQFSFEEAQPTESEILSRPAIPAFITDSGRRADQPLIEPSTSPIEGGVKRMVRGQEQWFPTKQAASDYLEHQLRSAEQDVAQLEGPLLHLPRTKADENDSTLKATMKAIPNIAAATAEAFSTPENINLMASMRGAPLVVRRAVAAGFSALMASHTPELIDRISEAETKQGKIEAGGNLLVNTVLAAAGAKESLHPDIIAPKSELETKAATVGPETAKAINENPPPSQQQWTAPSEITEPAKAIEAVSETVASEVPTELTAKTSVESPGPGAASPADFAPENSFVTSSKNAKVDEERVGRGLEPLLAPARRSFGEVWDKAMKRIEDDATMPENLVQELNYKPRALTDEEDAILLRHRVDLRNTFDKTAAEMLSAKELGNDEHAESLRIQAARLSDQLIDLEEATKVAGSETGRGLNARKMMAKEDFSLAQMVTEKRIAKGGRQLTPEEHSEVERLHKKLAELQERLDEYESKSGKKAADDAADEAVKEVRERVTKEPKGPRDLPAEREAVVEGIRNAAAENVPFSEIGRFIPKLAELFIREGITERDPLIDAVHNVLKDLIPDVTRRQTMDAISGYGDFKPLNPDAIKAKLRDLKGQMQQVAKLEDLLAREALKKTGVERKVPSDEERRLQKLVNEYKKRYGVTVTDPAKQLKSALDAIKTRLRNQISDLNYQIATGKKTVKEKTDAPTDREAEALKKERDALKEQFDQLFGKTELTDEQRVKQAMAAVEKSIADLETRIKNKDISPNRPVSKTPKTAELDAARAKRDALRDELQELRDADAGLQEQRAVKALEDSIAEYERKIAAGELTTPAKATLSTPATDALRAKRDALREKLASLRERAGIYDAKRIAAAEKAVDAAIEEASRQINEGDLAAKKATALTTPELEAKRAELAQLNKIKQQLRNAAKPKKSREEIALQSAKTRIRKTTADYMQRLAAGDFSSRTRRTVTPDAELNKLRAENERWKQAFRQGVLKDRLESRSRLEKAQDTFVKWRRGFLLSSPVTLAKLTSAAVQRMTASPIEEIIGSGISRLIPSVAKRAPREGGLSAHAEAKAITEAFTKGMSDAWQTLRTGKSDLDLLYGKPDVMPREMIDFFGNLHGALKASTKRNEFARSFEKRVAQAIDQGIDVSDPLVQTRLATEAYKDANRAIFLQDNRVVSAYRRAITALEEKDKATGKPTVGGKIGATVAKTLLPIVRVPTNIVAETLQYATGTVTGSARLANAFRKGTENLTPEQADLIMRDLKKGSVGAALLLLGFFNPDVFGGYYQPGEKRKEGDVKAGRAKVYDTEIPSFLLHNPLLETLQLGSTIRRVADSKLRKKDADSQGIPTGIIAGAMGLIDEVPFVREMANFEKLMNPHERDQYLNEMGKSVVIPQAVQWLARQMDENEITGETVQRKPSGLIETIETGLPILRENVPAKKRR